MVLVWLLPFFAACAWMAYAYRTDMHKKREMLESDPASRLLMGEPGRWPECDVSELGLGDSYISKANLGRFYGPDIRAIGSTNDATGRFFDWSLAVKSRSRKSWNNLRELKSTPLTVLGNRKFYAFTLQTVAVLDLQLPATKPFYVYRDVFSTEFAHKVGAKVGLCQELVDTGTTFDCNFNVESDFPYFAKLLFSLPECQGNFVRAIEDEDWIVEWTGCALIVFRLNHHAETDSEMEQLGCDALRLGRLIREATLVVDAYCDSRVALLNG